MPKRTVACAGTSMVACQRAQYVAVMPGGMTPAHMPVAARIGTTDTGSPA